MSKDNPIIVDESDKRESPAGVHVDKIVSGTGTEFLVQVDFDDWLGQGLFTKIDGDIIPEPLSFPELPVLQGAEARPSTTEPIVAVGKYNITIETSNDVNLLKCSNKYVVWLKGLLVPLEK